MTTELLLEAVFFRLCLPFLTQDFAECLVVEDTVLEILSSTCHLLAEWGKPLLLRIPILLECF